MSLINQQGMYMGEAPLNPLPYVNIAMQARQRKAAREEAIDKYYQKLPDTINDKGVRDNEVEIINSIKGEIFDFGVKNREALRNPRIDNGAAQLALDKLIRKGHTVARLSQAAAKDDLELGKMWWKKEYQDVINNDEFVKKHAAHNLPVTHPDYKPLNMAEITQLKPFDQVGYKNEVKTLFPYKEKVSRTTDPENPLYDIVTTTPEFSEDGKKGIYAYAAEKLHNSSTFRKYITKELAGTGILPKLQEISERVFNKPLESDEDIAAAYTVSQMPTSQIKEKSATDVEAVMNKKREEGMEDWKIKQQISDQYKRARIKLNNEGRIYEIDNVPLKLRTNSTTLPVVLGNDLGEVVDVTNWSAKELDDVLGADKNKYGIRNNKPFTVGDKQYIKITPEGFKFLDASGKVVAVEDKDVIINTNKRSQGLEKPVGTGKAKIRNNNTEKSKGELDDL